MRGKRGTGMRATRRPGGPIAWPSMLGVFCGMVALLGSFACSPAPRTTTVATLLAEMADFENLAERPEPFFKQATASSYDRESHKGGGGLVRQRRRRPIRAHGDERRPQGARAGRSRRARRRSRGSGRPIPDTANVVRFYFDGETTPRHRASAGRLCSGAPTPFGPVFSYISGTGGNLYFPLPYARSLKITIEETERAAPALLRNRLSHLRARDSGRDVRSEPGRGDGRTCRPDGAGCWPPRRQRARVDANRRPMAERPPDRRPGETPRFPGSTAKRPSTSGRPACSTRGRAATGRSRRGPQRLSVPPPRHRFRRRTERSRRRSATSSAPGPGVNPYENLFFTVDADGPHDEPPADAVQRSRWR